MERTHQQVDPLALCSHIYKSGRQCRQPVAKLGEVLCGTHRRSYTLSSPPVDPLVELAAELGEISEIHQVGAFIAGLMKLACQGRITFRRAVSLTYMANSLINAIRLQRAEDVRIAKEPGELEIDWTGIPRPDYGKARLANLGTPIPPDAEVSSNTLHTPAPA
ncbi:MAG TPA: hypothetical protein VIW23_10575 [Candidatus Acidoferrum sp.]